MPKSIIETEYAGPLIEFGKRHKKAVQTVFPESIYHCPVCKTPWTKAQQEQLKKLDRNEEAAVCSDCYGKL